MTAPRFAWMPLAATALTSARDHDLPAAQHALQAIADQYGPDVIPHVLLAWIDTMATHCGVKRSSPEHLVVVRWQREGTAVLTDADGTPPGVRWAGRAIAARIADDQEQYMALVKACGSAEEWRDNVVGVLDVCSAMLRVHAGGVS